jgi:hypothetical protein
MQPATGRGHYSAAPTASGHHHEGLRNKPRALAVPREAGIRVAAGASGEACDVPEGPKDDKPQKTGCSELSSGWQEMDLHAPPIQDPRAVGD